MQLYIAFHNIESDDIYKPMFCKVILEDDLDYPLHADFIRDILHDTRFVVYPYLEELCTYCDYEDLCHVYDNQSSPLGNLFSLNFLDTYLHSLAVRYNSDSKSKQIRSFYVDHVINELKSRVKENKFDFYYFVVDPESFKKLQGDRFEEFRESEKHSLYSLDEPPACFFDQCLLYDVRRLLGYDVRTKESSKREMKIREIYKKRRRETGNADFYNEFHFHIAKSDKKYAFNFFISMQTIDSFDEYKK